MRILIAEDDRISRMLLENTLKRWGYDVISVGEGKSAYEILMQPDAPRLAILDWMMPEMDGIKVLQEVRRSENENYIYVILLTAKNQKEDLLSGLESGADDYLMKPFDINELRLRLRAGTRVIALLEDLLAAREILRKQAMHDSLTLIYNHGAILDILVKELTRAKRDGTPLSLMMLDLDYFKTINDTYGHMAGDAVLRETAKRIHASIRSYDAVGRYGGEEFMVVLPGCNSQDAMIQAQRFLEKMRQEIHIPEGELSITGSFGVTATDVLDLEALDVSLMIQIADLALYQAKSKGRNRVELGGTHLLKLGNLPPSFSSSDPIVSSVYTR